MDLWILSQKKDQLVKTNLVRYAYFKDKLTNDELHIITNDDYDFGVYKTEERALEILNEIQSKILYYGNISDAYTSNHTAIVYEMPQE